MYEKVSRTKTAPNYPKSYFFALKVVKTTSWWYFRQKWKKIFFFVFLKIFENIFQEFSLQALAKKFFFENLKV